jgi:FkbM family methyltransferase
MTPPPSSGLSPSPAVARNLARWFLPRPLRNWLRNPAATRRWFTSAWAWRRGGAVELDFGAVGGRRLRLRCHPESGRTFSLFLHEPDSIAELRAFGAVLPPGVRLFDLGAHYGFFTLAALHLGGPDVRVLSVEPSPAAVRLLRLNLGLTRFSPQVRVLQAAVGGADGDLRMLAAGIASEHYMLAAGPGRGDAVSVPQWGLPSLARQAGWTPTLIKMDIEGAELELLAAPGNLRALRAWRIPLLLELHCHFIRQRGGDPAAVLRALDDAGYAAPRLHDEAVSASALLAREVARFACFPAG